MTGIKIFLVRPVSYVPNNPLYFERVFFCLEQEKKTQKYRNYKNTDETISIDARFWQNVVGVGASRNFT